MLTTYEATGSEAEYVSANGHDAWIVAYRSGDELVVVGRYPRAGGAMPDWQDDGIDAARVRSFLPKLADRAGVEVARLEVIPATLNGDAFVRVEVAS